MEKTKIQFLIELLLHHDLEPETRNLCITRIGEVEATYRKPAQSFQTHTSVPYVPTNQSPSTLANMTKHGLIPQAQSEIESQTSLTQPEQIAQTPQTAMALAKREQALAQALSGKPEVGRTSPRKF